MRCRTPPKKCLIPKAKVGSMLDECIPLEKREKSLVYKTK